MILRTIFSPRFSLAQLVSVAAFVVSVGQGWEWAACFAALAGLAATLGMEE